MEECREKQEERERSTIQSRERSVAIVVQSSGSEPWLASICA